MHVARLLLPLLLATATALGLSGCAGGGSGASPAVPPPASDAPSAATPAPAAPTPRGTQGPVVAAPQPVAPAGPIAPPEMTPAPVAGADPAAIDRSCRTDADCAVKDVGSCCGYFPACVNAGAATNPAAVKAQCAASGMSSTCGFAEVSACTCSAGQCTAAGPGTPVAR